MNSPKLIHHEQNRKDIVSFFRSLSHTHFSPQTKIFMRLPVPHFGTTSPINDYPRLSTCRRQLLAVPSMSLRPTTIAHRIAHNGVLAVSSRSLRRPTVARPEALVRVASPGQAQLQIFNLALIPIVGIRPRINHMKLNEHTRRLLLSPSVRIAHSELFLFITLFLRCYNSRTHPCINTRPTQPTQQCLILFQYEDTTRPSINPSRTSTRPVLNLPN
jgi:hypothetical protein